jgi:hypothetical protein
MLSVFMVNTITPSVIMLNVIMLSVVILNLIMLSTVLPLCQCQRFNPNMKGQEPTHRV